MAQRGLSKVLLPLVILAAVLTAGMISPASAAGLTLEQVKNGRYLIPGLIGSAPGEWVQLKDGAFKRDDPEKPLTVKIVAAALGPLSHQKTNDAAVVYGFSLGGTGFFMQLCAVVNNQGQLKNSLLVNLEDRAKINSLTIESGKIVLDLLVHAPMDPAPFPTLRRISHYALAGDRLVETGMTLPRNPGCPASPGASPQALYLRQTLGLIPFNPPEKFLAANFVTPEMDPPYIFGTVKDFAARLKCTPGWLIEADARNRYTYGDNPSRPGEYFVYLEEDRPDRVVYYVFADQSGIPPRQWPDWRRFFYKSATEEQYAPARAKLEQALTAGFPVGAELSFIAEDGKPLEVNLAQYLRQELKFPPIYDLAVRAAIVHDYKFKKENN